MTRQPAPMPTIAPLTTLDQAQACARLMSRSDPWVTLGRGYEESLAIISDPQREVYLALQNEEIVGFVVLVLHGAFVGYIQSLLAAPQVRGQGVGTQLLRFAEERIFRDFPNVFMCVSSFNTGARRLYERLGYEVVGELHDYVVAGHSEFLLRKTIAPKSTFRS